MVWDVGSDEALFLKVRPWLLVTDLAMLTYWGVTAAFALGVVSLPPAWLFSDYADPVVTVWNWSFLPLDVVFSLTGLAAAHRFRKGRPGWRLLTVISLCLTWCAGIMALSFWALRCSFDPLWWGLNAALVLWPLGFLPSFHRAFSAENVDHAQA